jgi:hypothetical protein
MKKTQSNLASENQSLRAQMQAMRFECEMALNYLEQAGHGSVHDPSWCRPKLMTRQQVQEAAIKAYHRIHAALKAYEKDTQSSIAE